jgi:hypothetical protein
VSDLVKDVEKLKKNFNCSLKAVCKFSNICYHCKIIYSKEHTHTHIHACTHACRHAHVRAHISHKYHISYLLKGKCIDGEM